MTNALIQVLRTITIWKWLSLFFLMVWLLCNIHWVYTPLATRGCGANAILPGSIFLVILEYCNAIWSIIEYISLIPDWFIFHLKEWFIQLFPVLSLVTESSLWRDSRYCRYFIGLFTCWWNLASNSLFCVFIALCFKWRKVYVLHIEPCEWRTVN